MARPTVLVADDDAGVRQSLRLCPEADGARVVCAGTRAVEPRGSERTPEAAPDE